MHVPAQPDGAENLGIHVSDEETRHSQAILPILLGFEKQLMMSRDFLGRQLECRDLNGIPWRRLEKIIDCGQSQICSQILKYLRNVLQAPRAILKNSGEGGPKMLVNNKL